jgi:hypothetical protein
MRSERGRFQPLCRASGPPTFGREKREFGLERCRRRAELSQTELGARASLSRHRPDRARTAKALRRDGPESRRQRSDEASRGSPHCSSVLNILPALQGFSVFSPLEQ